MNSDVIKELNTFLEGNFMAIHTYEKYISHLDDDKLKQVFQEIQQNHKRHAAMIAERIKKLGGQPVDDLGLMGRMVQLVQALKGPTKDPAHILKDALVGEQRGIEKSRELLQGDLDQESLSLVKNILAADQQHIELLNKLLH